MNELIKKVSIFYRKATNNTEDLIERSKSPNLKLDEAKKIFSEVNLLNNEETYNIVSFNILTNFNLSIVDVQNIFYNEHNLEYDIIDKLVKFWEENNIIMLYEEDFKKLDFHFLVRLSESKNLFEDLWLIILKSINNNLVINSNNLNSIVTNLLEASCAPQNSTELILDKIIHLSITPSTFFNILKKIPKANLDNYIHVYISNLINRANTLKNLESISSSLYSQFIENKSYKPNIKDLQNLLVDKFIYLLISNDINKYKQDNSLINKIPFIVFTDVMPIYLNDNYVSYRESIKESIIKYCNFYNIDYNLKEIIREINKY